jgi:hypothetical protein
VNPLKRAIRALFFDKNSINELKDDKKALIPGLIFVVFLILVDVFLTTGNHSATNMLVVSAFYLFYWLVLVSIAGFLPLLFGGKASYGEYLRVFNYSAIPFSIGFLPVAGIIGNAWGLAYLIYATKEVFSLTWHKVIDGTLMLAVVSFIIFTILVPYMIKPYGSITLSGMTLVSKPEKEGLADFQAWDISVNYRIPENIYDRADTLGQKQCIQDLIRDYSMTELQKHTFLLTSATRETIFRNIAITKDKKACCVYVDDLGKTLPGGGSTGRGFVQVDAICESKGMKTGGAYDLEISIIYETKESGKTTGHNDIGHIRGPNPIS